MQYKLKAIGAKIDIYVLIPISNQGSGRTEFFKSIIRPFFEQHKELNLKIISSEIINDKLIKKCSLEFPTLPKEELFLQTRKKFKKAYNEEIERIFEEIYKEALDTSVHANCFFLYVDKNHPLNDDTQLHFRNRFRDASQSATLKFVSLNLDFKLLIENRGNLSQFKEANALPK